ncbi:glycosyltransferase [Nostoc sp. 'Peltigera malacea cyanobiont' DB3992]|uniref:glycosyltransferase n=1 Tax=Nostoc sp. 'Peltigera malacea cyanobiont' DB3992 TaxID=1206980 RepID=UPI000C056B60|nr:glycosyltransferase [Nostoc sp. 'Peltigera malacea cyanobiont' DB3992]PHM05919.1 hypothetical protein CK516_37440 [Nostoc sp. 'Peltigera malacea cyanobiont' DB3992]
MHDQDALNAILAGKWGELEPGWNQMPYLFQYSSWQDSPFTEDVFNQLINNPDIIHFSTKDKPWHNSCNHPDKDLFFNTLIIQFGLIGMLNKLKKKKGKSGWLFYTTFIIW